MDPEPATEINADPRGFGFVTPLFMAGSLEQSEQIAWNLKIKILTVRLCVQIPVPQRIRRGNESSGGKGG
jgi:hypothetical protein